MALTVTHTKHNNVTDWTQAQLDAQIALGNFAPGTLLADIPLPSDWNANHTIAGTLAHNTDLTGLQGGTTNEYYHLTSAQYTVVQNTSGTNTGDQTNITGNAGTATALQTARAIGGVNFDGTAAITPQQIQPASETSDNTCFPLFVNAASGTAQQPKYNASFGFNASTNALSFAGLNLSGLTASKVVFTDSSKNLTSVGIGTSSQFIKGDGSLDSTAYGSVTSVTFTGDGTVLSSTPSSAVTTTGTLTAALANAGAKTVLGNPTGSSAAPVYTTDPVVSGTVTANIFNATATGTTVPYQLNGVQVFWQDATNSNLSVGNNTLRNGIAGSFNNTAIGVNALNAVTTGVSNIGVGASALKALTNGSNNTALGASALLQLTTGSSNVGIGQLAGETITTGGNNIYIGLEAGGIVSSGTTNNNVVIGEGAFLFFSSVNNTTAIGTEVGGGFSGFGQSISNCVLIGYDNTTQPNGNNSLNIANAINGTGLGGTPNIGIGAVASPTARLHLPAGTAAANTAPLKFTSGTNLTSAVAGAMEYDGTQLYFSPSTTRHALIQDNGARLTPGIVPVATTSGYLIDGGASATELSYLSGVTSAIQTQLNARTYYAGSFSGVGTATTTFTVTIGVTMANTTYKVNATPTVLLAAAVFYINNKTTTTFDVVYLAGLTGTVKFDYSVFP